MLALSNCHTANQTAVDPAFYAVKDSSNENELKNNLLVFVGEKILVVKDTSNRMSFDSKFKARYKIIKTVYGSFKGDTIEFDVYDHYGIPPFCEYKNVLLFVKHLGNNVYIHEKYQYFDVYKTKNGNWASTYAAYWYAHNYDKKLKVPLQKIDFAEPVSIDLSKLTSRQRRAYYPQPYYKIKGDTAVAIYGVYLPDLFRLKKKVF
ncbi:MAG: hypothetical protein M0D57_05635 [Sphingobacteriales bacterium JAD_PAG50586_3]|nr:MAG: hypothetical protein M0D57_05635 [Sphingobacteriales bacterium JAD_PAG50586_3]